MSLAIWIITFHFKLIWLSPEPHKECVTKRPRCYIHLNLNLENPHHLWVPLYQYNVQWCNYLTGSYITWDESWVTLLALDPTRAVNITYGITYCGLINVTQLPNTVYPKKYAHGFCLPVLCCGYTLTDFPISTRLTSLALWQSNDCPSASKATLMNMDKYFMWIHYEWLHNHNKAKHNKTVCTLLGIYCMWAATCDWRCLNTACSNWLVYHYDNTPSIYSISQEICTRFCCALLCCGYAIVHNEFTWSIYPYSSGLLCWHWGNR